MAGDQKPPSTGGTGDVPSGAGQGWTALSYLIGGMLVWGFVGWLVDRWLHTGGVATGIGIVLGMAGGVVLVIRKLGTPT